RCDNGANWTLHQTPSNSPVDFDLDFTVKLTDYESMRRVTVTIDHLPGVKDLRAFKGSLSEEVVCRFEGVNDK
ncbi:hypothetical protein OY671_012921, partial [Metschnikowia pulcherrima]